MLWLKNQQDGNYPQVYFQEYYLVVRSYEDGEFQVDHVLYLGFIDICLTLYYEE